MGHGTEGAARSRGDDIGDILARLLDERLGDLKRFVDRRISEVSAEVSASVELMDIQDKSVHRHLAEVRERIAQIAAADPREAWLKGGMELEFVVEVTEQAANRVMDVAERLFALAQGDLSTDAAHDSIRDLAATLFEACSFQDLVGQRVERVRFQLKEAEKAIADAVGDDADRAEAPSDGTPDGGAVEIGQDDVDRLLGAPPSSPVAQGDIDRLFD